MDKILGWKNKIQAFSFRKTQMKNALMTKYTPHFIEHLDFALWVSSTRTVDAKPIGTYLRRPADKMLGGQATN
jgi:hypothetical protein